MRVTADPREIFHRDPKETPEASLIEFVYEDAVVERRRRCVLKWLCFLRLWKHTRTDTQRYTHTDSQKDTDTHTDTKIHTQTKRCIHTHTHNSFKTFCWFKIWVVVLGLFASDSKVMLSDRVQRSARDKRRRKKRTSFFLESLFVSCHHHLSLSLPLPCLSLSFSLSFALPFFIFSLISLLSSSVETDNCIWLFGSQRGHLKTRPSLGTGRGRSRGRDSGAGSGGGGRGKRCVCMWGHGGLGI